MEQIVRDAITALTAFEVATADDALWLLSTWRRRDQLSVADIRTIVTHYRTATPVNPNLTATDPAPAGASHAVDKDGDKWSRVGDDVWCHETLYYSTGRLVRDFGPIEWLGADGNPIGTSR